MAIWRESVLPRLLHWGMSAERNARYRPQALSRARGNVLELGFGTGLNLPAYPAAVSHVTGIEPNPGMRKLAVRKMHETSFPLTLLDVNAETMPFDDGEFDCVVSTWTLCSIQDLDRALSEAFRVLKPGGELLFLEHGLAPDPNLQKWQHRLTRVHKVLFDGCHADRNISQFITSAGFSIATLENFFSPGVPKVEGYMYQGAARADK